MLDREPGGNFRRTQRFQDENGEISANITANYKVTSPFVLTGGKPSRIRCPLALQSLPRDAA